MKKKKSKEEGISLLTVLFLILYFLNFEITFPATIVFLLMLYLMGKD